MSCAIVTGAAGVVGNALAAHLRRKGQEVVALAGRSECNLESFDETMAVFERARPQDVYHIAGAVFGLGGNSAFPGDAFRRNILINTNVIEASRLVGARKVVAMGSTAMYADQEPAFFREETVLDGRPHASEQAYGFAKRAMLVQLESYRAQFGIPFAFAIATNMYGPHDRFDPLYGHVIPSLITKFVKAQESGDEVQIWGDGSPTRDFLYADDAARGLDLLMQKGEGAYNLATGASRRIVDLVSCLAGQFPGVGYRWDTSKPMGQRSRSYAVERIRQLGFEPSCDLETGIRRTVEWYLANPALIRHSV